MSLLVISMLFISEYKKVTSWELASQTISGSFKAMCAIHYSYREQPNCSKGEFGKVCSSPGAESVSEGTAGALLIIHPVHPNLEGQFETRWCLELFNELEEFWFRHTWLWWLWIKDTDLWIGQVTWSTHSSDPTDSGYEANSNQGEYGLCLCIGSGIFNFAKWKYENLHGKKTSFEALRRELQKNWSVFKSLKSPEASD